MPTIKDIDELIPEAMRAKDTVRLTVLRSLKAAFVNESIALKKTGGEPLTDAEALAVIRRLGKQRKDSIEQFRKGSREELAKAEEAELAVLDAFLPTQLSEEEIRKIAQVKKETLGISDKTKIGQLIGAVMKETKGCADGALVKKVVEGVFQ
ncbi:MAG: hypothetical protein Greene041679_362 [Parcubacteria group bacterium Greene0416_79]|nr:MAG: hypothetical protein Greene041679_362 [Parcubacteria group bacterium Greene0416_79]